MSTEYEVYYQELLQSIAIHQETIQTEMERIETCFKCSLDCWGRLQKKVKKSGWDSSEQEIYFFKHIKPGFTAYIEYYTCRYHALLFRPAGDRAELARFWKWELRKIEKFHENNSEFCDYMREGRTDKDPVYFLRSANPGMHLAAGRIHDLDPGTSTAGDHLVTMMHAYELYGTYIRDEMKKLGGYFFLTK